MLARKWPGRSPAALIAIGAALTAALLGGCGGGSYTKRDYVARANAICASALRKARSIPPPATGEEFSPYLKQVLPAVRSEVSQLRALRVPHTGADDRRLLSAYLGALAQTAREYDALAAAAERGDSAAIASSEAALRANRASVLGARYGLSSCGAHGSTTA